MSYSQLYLIRQAGSLRVTFGINRHTETAFTSSQSTLPGQLELLGVVNCRNVRSATRVLQMLHERYHPYQDGGWFSLTAGEVSTLVFWFQAMNTAVSTVKEHFYQQLGGVPQKKYPRTRFNKAVSWLREHDPECTLSCRVIAERAGVSTGTAHSAVRYLLSLNEAE